MKTMLMQNFGVTNKEHYGMLWYFWSGQLRVSLGKRCIQCTLIIFNDCSRTPTGANVCFGDNMERKEWN